MLFGDMVACVDQLRATLHTTKTGVKGGEGGFMCE